MECMCVYKSCWTPAICKLIAGIQSHYVKGNKWDRVRQILYAITYMWNLKINEVHGYRAQVGPHGSSVLSFRHISEKKK